MHILLQHTNNAPPTAAATALRGIFDQATAAAKAHTTVECVLGKLECPEWVNHCIPMPSWPGLGT